MIERILHPKEETKKSSSTDKDEEEEKKKKKKKKKLMKATKILKRVVTRDLYRCVGQARVCNFYVPLLQVKYVHISITKITLINVSQSPYQS